MLEAEGALGMLEAKGALEMLARVRRNAPLEAPAQWLQFCHWLQALHSETAACTSRNTINIGPKILGSL